MLVIYLATLCYLTMIPKHETCVAGRDLLKRNHQVLPLSEKLQVYHWYIWVGENIVYKGPNTIRGFRHPWGFWYVFLVDNRGLLYPACAELIDSHGSEDGPNPRSRRC